MLTEKPNYNGSVTPVKYESHKKFIQHVTDLVVMCDSLCLYDCFTFYVMKSLLTSYNFE